MNFLGGLLLMMFLSFCLKVFGNLLWEAIKGIFGFFYIGDCVLRIIEWALFGKEGTKPRFYRLPEEALHSDELDPADEMDGTDEIRNEREREFYGFIKSMVRVAFFIGIAAFLIFCLTEAKEMNRANGIYSGAQKQQYAIQDQKENGAKRAAERAAKEAAEKAKQAEEKKLKEHLPEIAKAFDGEMQNQFSSVYQSCQVDNGQLIHINVGPEWYKLKEEKQKNIITQTAQIFKKLLQDQSLTTQNLNIYFMDTSAKKYLGGWGDVVGATIEKQ